MSKIKFRINETEHCLADLVGAVQIDPMKPELRPPGAKCLQLRCDILLSSSAFKFGLRRYHLVAEPKWIKNIFFSTMRFDLRRLLFGDGEPEAGAYTRPPFQVNLSRF